MTTSILTTVLAWTVSKRSLNQQLNTTIWSQLLSFILPKFKRLWDEDTVPDFENPQWLNYQEAKMEIIVSLFVTLIIGLLVGAWYKTAVVEKEM